MESNSIELVRHFRTQLNQIPEPANSERATSEYVLKVLKESNPDHLYTNIGGYGVVAGYIGKEGGASKMFRCELDAVSTKEGVKHLCGHDGHMAILLGVAQILAANRDFAGVIWLLFQPAEEIGQGAKRMSEELKKRGLDFDYSFALHNKPGLPLGRVLIYRELYAATSVGVELCFKGSASHASHPELACSPFKALVESAQYALELNERGTLFAKFTLGTIVNLILGEPNYGVTPGEGVLRITVRSFANETLESYLSLLEQFATEIAKRDSLQLVITYSDLFPATINNNTANKMTIAALESNNIVYEYAEEAARGSDDFAYFAQNSKSSYFDIGNGVTSGDLHQIDYLFSDELLDYGVRIFRSLIYE